MARGATTGVGGAETDEKTTDHDGDESAESEECVPTEDLVGRDSGKVMQAETRESCLRGGRDRNVIGLADMGGHEAADEDTREENEVPEAGIFPVVAKELRLARQECRAHVAEIARDAKDFVADQQQRRNKEADDWAGDEPGPCSGQPVAHRLIQAPGGGRCEGPRVLQ